MNAINIVPIISPIVVDIEQNSSFERIIRDIIIIGQCMQNAMVPHESGTYLSLIYGVQLIIARYVAIADNVHR